MVITAGLMEEPVLYTGSPHLKANANKTRFAQKTVQKSRSDDWDGLNAAVRSDRADHGKKPIEDKPRQPVSKESQISRTDWGKAIYERRRDTVERSFADGKRRHGHRHARVRSLLHLKQ